MPTSVTYESDPKLGDRTIVRISAKTREAVEYQISKFMDLVDRDGGFAQFVGPGRIAGGFAAHGEIILQQTLEQNQ